MSLNSKLLPDKGYERLEPDMIKVASPVLRRGRASNRSILFGKVASPVLRRGRTSNRSSLFGKVASPVLRRGRTSIRSSLFG